MPLHRDPRDRLDAIERELDRDAVDADLRERIEDELPDVYQEYISLQSEKAFDRHLAKFITEAYAKQQNGDRGPLCSCAHGTPTACPLTNGKIPAKVRYSHDSVLPQQSGRDRVLEYLHQHPGGEVLHEAIDAWDEREGKLHRKIASIHNELLQARKDNLREVPSQ